MKLLFSVIRFFFKRLTDAIKNRPVTIEYPFVAKPVPQMARTRLKNNFGDCTGCLDCEQCCPTKAIEIRAAPFPYNVGLPRTSKGILFERNVESFSVNYSQCVFCGICVNTCPTQSLQFDRKLFPPKSRQDGLTVDLVHIPRSMRRGQ